MSSRDHARKFHFLREIASGGFGSVYLAKVEHTDGFSRIAAVKLLHPKWSENREVAQRMRDEARLLGWLHHRNIVDVIDLTTIDGRVAVVMEYLEAVDLRTVGQALRARGEPMSARAAIEALAFVASALDAAYNRPPYPGARPLRVIHRDLKPSNIMVDESGTVKVLDFGVARADFEHRESHTQELQFGSVDYMPPERLFNEPEDPASDVYSLGGTLYEVLAFEKFGKAKGRADRHAAMVRARLDALVPTLRLPEAQAQAVRGLLSRMVAYDHAARPTAAEVAREARALARGIEGEALVEWAERVIPPLVRAAREAPRAANPLVDRTATEDTGMTGGPELTDSGYTDPGMAAWPPPPELPARAPAVAPPATPEAAPVAPGLVIPDEAPVDDAATWIYDGAPPGVAAQRGAAAPAAASAPAPAADAASGAATEEPPTRARPVARPPTSRRGPPPPVTLDPLVPPAEDPGLLSAPFPRHLNPDRHAAVAPVPEPEVPVPAPEMPVPAPAAPPAAPVAPAAPAAPPRAPLRPLPGPTVADAEPDDDDSDARLIELRRPSPTLVFPADPSDRALDDEDELDATVPAMDRVLVEKVRAALGEPPPASPSALAEPEPVAPPPEARPGAPVITHRVVSAQPIAPPVAAVPVAPTAPEPLPTARVRRPTPSLEPSRPTVVPAVAPAPPPLPDPEPVPARSGPNWLLVIGGALGFLGLVGAVGLWAVWTYVIVPWQAGAALDASPHATDAPAAAAAPGERPEGAIRFVSAAPDTTRIVASCDGKEASGATWVDWTGPAPTTCTVRVQLADRTRLYAELPQPTPAAYTCFADGGKTCDP